MTSPTSTLRHTANRLTVRVGPTLAEFRARYEQPFRPGPTTRSRPWPTGRPHIRRCSTWSPPRRRGDSSSTTRSMPRRWCGLAGDQAAGVAYLMGNHTIMERMYGHEPAVLLYAPLHTVIWGDPDGGGYFTFDKPSDQIASFGNPQVAEVGLELDQKMAALLDHLGVSVPGALLTH